MPEDRSTNKLPLNTDSVEFCFCMTSRHLWKSVRGVCQLFGNILSPWLNCSLYRDWLSLGCLFLQVKTCYIQRTLFHLTYLVHQDRFGGFWGFFGCSLPIYSEVIKGKLYIEPTLLKKTKEKVIARKCQSQNLVYSIYWNQDFHFMEFDLSELEVN